MELVAFVRENVEYLRGLRVDKSGESHYIRGDEAVSIFCVKGIKEFL